MKSNRLFRSCFAAMIVSLSAGSYADNINVISSDYTDSGNHIGEVYDFFDVSVRTERGNPVEKPARFGRNAKVNTVRMLGGWYNQDLSGDTYLWDGEKFTYNFEAATRRIDHWIENDWDIFQIVLDNPPWAFQEGYNFVEEPDGVHYLAKDRVGVYGNGLPPQDPKAWNTYIQSFIGHLVDKYGKETVASWRFRVGSEIDTRPQHWSATRQEFFDHYENTVEAVHAVLPEAAIGVHFREAAFVSRYVDYTGEKEDAYATHFVSWAKENNVPYDFLAISYYPMVTHPEEMDMDAVYQNHMAPILEHEDYNSDASFEIHEFKYIVKMKRAGFSSVESSHGSAFFALFSKMMLEKNVGRLFQWGNVKRDGTYNSEALTQSALFDMVGNELYQSNVEGEPKTEGNLIDGIFTRKADDSGFDLLMFSFNKDDFSYQDDENIAVELKVDQPKNTKYRYRVAQFDRSNNREQMFFAEFPKSQQSSNEGGWRNDDVHPLAPVNDALNEEGRKFFNSVKDKYDGVNELKWSEWKTSSVVDEGVEGSMIKITNTIPSFSVQKYQIEWLK
ncbi:GH39 family glycosyl hydrolase [Vibrio astriarenae]|uniref:GH39 family glycosyl hydrolase n=1 Tax=Vibrio astriarenae TaxID=1481923 RepID=UPI0037351120